MLSASVFDSAPFEDASAPTEVDPGLRRGKLRRCQIVQAFVIAAVIVVIDEGCHGAFEVTGQVVVFEQDAALQREVPALDLYLRHRMIGAFRVCGACPGPRASRQALP